MRPGQYAAGDGSFGRSAGAAMGRGVLLLAVALLIGVVLLNATEDQPPGTDLATSSRGGGGATEDRGTTTTTVSTTTTAAARAPADVKVIVANASDVKGAAGGATDALKEKQYNALAPGNAPKAAESAVYFTAEYNREAAAIAAALEIPAALVKPMPTPPPVDIKTANVLVVLGADHAARFGTTATTAAGGSSTTTTVKATTTTASG